VSRLAEYLPVALVLLGALGMIVVLGAIWATRHPDIDISSDDGEEGRRHVRRPTNPDGQDADGDG
jgi:hypothetical protein